MVVGVRRVEVTGQSYEAELAGDSRTGVGSDVVSLAIYRLPHHGVMHGPF